ncbi:MAG: hypothetical protein PHQ04_08765 [Opitutaceae bacterium]|nr:hypothetical protein [Opitutaceae bacterium]
MAIARTTHASFHAGVAERAEAVLVDILTATVGMMQKTTGWPAPLQHVGQAREPQAGMQRHGAGPAGQPRRIQDVIPNSSATAGIARSLFTLSSTV